MKVRKKPIVVDAVRWLGDNQAELATAFPDLQRITTDERELVIATLEGDHLARVGDWIIRGVKGDYYPCKPDIFEATYEPAP